MKKLITDASQSKMITELNRLFAKMSHFNAAEGNWRQETSRREECQKMLRKKVIQMIAVGFTLEEIKILANDWLLSSYNYCTEATLDEANRLREQYINGNENPSENVGGEGEGKRKSGRSKNISELNF